jgi:hypothetical protein
MVCRAKWEGDLARVPVESREVMAWALWTEQRGLWVLIRRLTACVLLTLPSGTPEPIMSRNKPSKMASSLSRKVALLPG